MITVSVVDQNALRVVLEGVVDGYPQLTERWTVSVSAIGNDPGLLAQARDELIARLETRVTQYLIAQEAIANL